MNYKKSKIIFLLIITFFILRGIYYCFFIPPWESPDEPGHVKYVLYLYKNRQLPSSKLRYDIGPELVKSWKYQKSYIVPKKINDLKYHRQLFDRSIYLIDNGLDNITGNPVLYYAYLLPFYLLSLGLSSYMSLIFLRLGSLLLGVISLVIIHKITKLIFKRTTSAPNLVILLVVLQPMFTFLTSVVNNDNMVILFFALLIYLSLRLILLAKKISFINLIIVGLIASLSTLTKPQMLLDVFLFGGLVVVNKNLNIKRKIIGMVSSLIIPLSWYVFSSHSSLTFAMGKLPGHPLPLWQYPIVFILNKQPIGIFMSFWGFFGWLDVPMPKWIYLLFTSVILFPSIGWFNGFRNKMIGVGNIFKMPILFTLVSSVVYIIAVFSYDSVYYSKTYHFGLQGRYFLPVLFALTFFIIGGLMFYKPKLRNIFLTYIISIFILSQAVMYIAISAYYYHSLVLIPPLARIYGFF